MRIVAVEIRNHPGLGDLDIDLRGGNGRAAGVVVIAGENGCGKTVILEAIFAALAPTRLLLNTSSRLASGYYRVLIELDEENTSKSFREITSTKEFEEIHKRWPDFDGIIVTIDNTRLKSSYQLNKSFRLLDKKETELSYDSAEVLGSSYFCFYSEANVSFEVPRVETIRTSAGLGQQNNASAHVMFPVRSGSALAGEVTQLLVDLQAADDAEVARWLDKNEGRPPEQLRNRRIKRFTEAFARIVPHKKYQGVETVGGEHRVTFVENNFRTSIGDLSTGEKQIIFRGAFLLRQFDNLAGAVVMIDEPELSLHPTWQTDILPFYEKIAKGNDEKASQIIMATHSPFVVHGSPEAKHIILRRNHQTGTVRADNKPTYLGFTTAEIAIEAFDLGSFARDAYGKRLSFVVEGASDKKILEIAWRVLRPNQPLPFMVLSAGGAKGVQQLLGSSEPGKLGPLLGALTTTGIDRVLGLFDFDAEGFAQWNGAVKATHSDEKSDDITSCATRKRSGAAVWAALLPVPSYRLGYADLESWLSSRSILTIELLFPDSYVADLLSWQPTVGAPGCKVLQATTNVQKQAVAHAAEHFPTEAFIAFTAIFALIDHVLSYSNKTENV